MLDRIGLHHFVNESDQDAEGRLLDNLDGIRWILPQLEGEPAGDRPEPRTWTAPQKPKGAATAQSSSSAGVAPSPGTPGAGSGEGDLERRASLVLEF